MLESSPGTSRPSNDDVTTESTTQELDSYNVNEFLNQKNAEYVSRLVPTIVFIVVLMIVGMVGNTVVFTVYYKRFKPSVTRTYILAMNVCAFLINVLSIPLKILDICINSTFDSVWGCKTSGILRHFLILFSAFLLVAVSVDRQNVVCNVHHSLQYSLERAYVSILLCAVVAFVLSVPHGVFIGNSKASFADSNITGVRCDLTHEYKGSTAVSVYDVTLGIVYMLCVVTMSVSYGRIVLHLWRHQKTIRARGIAHRKITWFDYLKPVTSNTISSRYAEKVCLDRPLSKKANHNSTSVNEEQAIPISETDITTPLSQTEKNVCHVEEPSSTRPFLKQAKPNNEALNEGQEILSSATNICTSLSQPEPTLCHVEECRFTVRQAVNQEIGTVSDITIVLPQPKQQLTIQNTEVSGQVRRIPSRTTFMLVVLTVLFVLNYIPYLYIIIIHDKVISHNTRQVNSNGRMIGLHSVYVNSALSPLVFSFCSGRFLYEFRSLFRIKNM